jgi:hypothetical protein
MLPASVHSKQQSNKIFVERDINVCILIDEINEHVKHRLIKHTFTLLEVIKFKYGSAYNIFLKTV